MGNYTTFKKVVIPKEYNAPERLTKKNNHFRRSEHSVSSKAFHNILEYSEKFCNVRKLVRNIQEQDYSKP